MIYVAPSVRDLNLASYEGFLTGSVTSELVEVNDVTVKTYENGFGSNDFKEISFD